MQHAHEQGLVHRDIKPGNLRVSADGTRVKVLDFGLARFQSETGQEGRLTRVGSLVGTVDYVSPEQALDARKADFRSDLYSLGCTLFFLLSGRPPFEGDDHVQRLSARLLNPAPSIRSLRADVPSELDAVLTRLLAKEPAQRYQTPAEVAAALAPFCRKGTPSAARPSANAKGESSDASDRHTSAAPCTQRQAAPSTKPVPGKKESANSGPSPIISLPPKAARRQGKGPWLLVAGGSALLLAGLIAALGVFYPRPGAPADPSSGQANLTGPKESHTEPAPGILPKADPLAQTPQSETQRPKAPDPKPEPKLDPKPEPKPDPKPENPPLALPATPDGLVKLVLGMAERKDSDVAVLKSALDKLLNILGPKDANLAADLQKLLTHADPQVVRKTALALANIGGEAARPALPALRGCLRDPDSRVQELAASGLAQLGQASAPAVPELAEVLGDERRFPTVRRNAALALSRIGPEAKPALPQLITALKAGQPAEVRQFALEAVAQLRYPANEEALPAVVEILRGEREPRVRQRAIWCLFNVKELDKIGAVIPLTEMLDEKDVPPVVRYDAARLLAWALKENAPSKAADVLLHMLKARTVCVYESSRPQSGGTANVSERLGGDGRFLAAQALGWMGSKGRRDDVKKALEEAAGDKDQRLREAAGKALQAIFAKVEVAQRPEPRREPKPKPEPTPASHPGKFPLPTLAAQAAAEKLIKDLFKDNYAQREPADLRELSTRLFEQGLETKDDTTARFVCFREAADLAAKAGDYEAALRVVDQMAKEYSVDAWELKTAALNTASQVTTAAASKALAETILTLADGAVAEDNYEAALRLLPVAEASARKSQTLPLVTRLQARGQEVRHLLKQYEVVRAAATTLKEKPDDPDSNLALGKFYCFEKRQWDRGLPLLLRGSDPQLKSLAEKEQAKPGSPMEKAELADAWYDRGETEKVEKVHYLRRAWYWYQQALPDLQGIHQTRVEKRLDSLAQQFPEFRLPPEMHRLTGHKGWVQAVVFSPDGRRILSGGRDGAVRVWDAESGKELLVFEPDCGPITGLAFSADGRRILASSGPETGPDQKKHWYVHRWNSETGRAEGGLSRSDTTPPSLAGVLAPFPDGQRVVDIRAVSAGGFQIGCYFHISSFDRVGEQTNKFVETKVPLAIWAFAGDGQKALSGGGEGRDSSLLLWDLKTGKTRLLASPGTGVLALALSADGRRALSGGPDGVIRLWDVTTSKEVRRLPGHTGAITSLAFSPDGRRALSGGKDKTVRLWDVATGKEVRRLSGHTDSVVSLNFSPDGRCAVSGGMDKTIRVWRLPK